MVNASSSILSFAGKKCKWDTAEDAKELVDAINGMKDLKCLVLEANTLGVEAAKVIGDALANHPEFERAHWKDLFTGRLKDEIPEALKHLFSGLMRAKAKLLELDLSDNALGPHGVKGMVDFMKSPVCYSLQELKLNNNGLGINGGTTLAKSLLELVTNAKDAGRPLKLKIFIAGRNRLEKEGAEIYAELFSSVKTLEEIAMPQNGISYKGIGAIAKAISNNPNLRILNLNDNIFTPRGASAMAEHLPCLSNLEIINFGDCLLKTDGALLIANALENSNPKLKELHLDGNEIRIEGGLAIADAIANKKHLHYLMLDSNEFGESGCDELRRILSEFGMSECLQSLEDDQEPGDEDEEDSDDDDESDSCQSDEEVVEVSPSNISPLKRGQLHIDPILCTVGEFADQPSPGHLLGLGKDASQLLIQEANRRANETECYKILAFDPDVAFFHECFPFYMKTASLHSHANSQVSNAVKLCTTDLIKAIFERAETSDLVSVATNTLLVQFGLIKPERKTFKIEWDIRNCLLNLSEITPILPKSTKNTLQFFFSRPESSLEKYADERHKVMFALYRN